MKKKAISPIIATILMIALVISISAVVYKVTKNMVEENLKKSKSCAKIYDKVLINSEYTCYNDSNRSLIFTINRKDIDIDGLLISISNKTDSEVYKLPSETTNLKMWNVSGSNWINATLLEKNSGKKYRALGINSKPNSIKIAIIINGDSCGIFNPLNEISVCS